MENSLYDLCQVVKDKKVYHQVGISYKDDDDLNERLAHLLLTGEAVDYVPDDGSASFSSPKEDFNNATIESLQSVLDDHGDSINNFPSGNTYSFKEFKLSGNTNNIELHEFFKAPFERLNELKKLEKQLGSWDDRGLWVGHFEINPRNVFYSVK